MIAYTWQPEATSALTHGPRPVSIPGHHLPWPIALGGMLSDQLMEPGDPGHPFRQPRPGQPLPSGIHQGNIVMILGPVIPGRQHSRILLPALQFRTSQRGTGAP